jgi:hypothetical protein
MKSLQRLRIVSMTFLIKYASTSKEKPYNVTNTAIIRIEKINKFLALLRSVRKTPLI